ncbi:hypothetical protein SISNIDRAFT_485763 [Sistotremastrum niveocremeum HHB9708]|uniref:Uncharacterized protein n=1 Tax=Sistotremastrum niveocremeum HHB9708 TaxID=1314777 RepID=A0A164UT43_9AGAM|nr:hypothetical protein SISNIDRAFT_485763 [Sistotremastrum niveocremeum HHB9708]
MPDLEDDDDDEMTVVDVDSEEEDDDLDPEALVGKYITVSYLSSKEKGSKPLKFRVPAALPFRNRQLQSSHDFGPVAQYNQSRGLDFGTLLRAITPGRYRTLVHRLVVVNAPKYTKKGALQARQPKPVFLSICDHRDASSTTKSKGPTRLRSAVGEAGDAGFEDGTRMNGEATIECLPSVLESDLRLRPRRKRVQAAPPTGIAELGGTTQPNNPPASQNAGVVNGIDANQLATLLAALQIAGNAGVAPAAAPAAAAAPVIATPAPNTARVHNLEIGVFLNLVEQKPENEKFNVKFSQYADALRENGIYSSSALVLARFEDLIKYVKIPYGAAIEMIESARVM